MTQIYIADILNVKPAIVSKYESNQIEPNIEALKKYAEIFDVAVDELLKDENEEQSIDNLNILKMLKEQKRDEDKRKFIS